MVIINGLLHPVDGPVIPRGFVAWEGERIMAVGGMDALPDRDLGPVIDAKGAHVTPGYIDAHCHLGLFPDSRSYDSVVSDGPESIAPDFDPLAHADLTDRYFAQARAAGIAAVAIAPGSKNPVAGRIACVRTDGTVLRPFAAFKLSLGETPERTTGLSQEDLARLLAKVLPGLAVKTPVHVHAHRATDIATALDLAKRFGLEVVVVHGTEGYRMAQTIAQSGASVITGPILTDRSKPELANATLETPAILRQAGVRIAICTDHPEVPGPYLTLCAGLAVRGGLSEEEALAAITLRPAEILGLADDFGSLTVGKTADIVVTPGPLFSIKDTPSAVILGGGRVI